MKYLLAGERQQAVIYTCFCGEPVQFNDSTYRCRCGHLYYITMESRDHDHTR